MDQNGRQNGKIHVRESVIGAHEVSVIGLYPWSPAVLVIFKLFLKSPEGIKISPALSIEDDDADQVDCKLQHD